MSKQQQSLKQILPMIQKICSRKKDMNYSHGNTYKENGLALKHHLTTVKINNIVSVFARKLRRNITSSKPVNFEIKQKKGQNQQKFFNFKGWDIEDRIEGIILFLDIVMTIVNLFLSTFQGLLDDFRQHDSTSTIVVVFKCIMLVVFVARLLMAFVTATFQDGKMYEYVTDIVLKLLKEGSIFIHIFNLVMVPISLAYPSDSTVGIISFSSAFLKLFLIVSNLKILQLLFINSRRKFYMWNLTKIIIFNIIFGHFISTCLLAISKIDGENNWVIIKLYNNGLLSQSQPWHQVYLWSYYWACTIMLTVGFGDICPVNQKEAVIVAIIEIFSSIVLAYNISEVGSIVTAIRKNSQSLQRKLGVLRRMMANNPVPEELQLRIESYLTHQVEIEDKFQYDQHSRIIKALPQQLKQQYLAESNRILYSNIPVLKYFQKTTLAKLNKSFEGKVFYQGENIMQAKTGNENVIIMRSGTISLNYWKQGSNINGSTIQAITIKEQDLKGLLISTNIFSHNSPINYDVVAEKYSFGMRLSREKFLQVLKENNLDYYFYRSILDKHEKEEHIYQYVECQYCQNEYHNKFQCPKLHYYPLKSLVIIKKLKQHQSTSTPNTLKSLRIQKPPITHSYLTRKSIFTFLELQLSSTKQDQIESNLEVDEPYNFPMYFRQSNPQSLKGISFYTRQLSEKQKVKKLKTIRTCLLSMSSN